MTDSGLPAALSGVRVLAFEQYGAGPFGTQYLSDLGAEVIKIEQPGTSGDYVRELGPYFVGGRKSHTASSLFFQAFNRNKKSICLRIDTAQGRAVLSKLVASADAVANNLRGDVPAKLGLTYNDLKQDNAAIVCAHCSAYGRTGPRRDWPGFDFLMQAEAGYFQMSGEPDTPPTRFGLSVVDYMAGLSMSFGLVSSILQARQSGQGRDVDVTLFDTALSNLAYLGVWALNEDYAPTRLRRSAHPSVVPCQLYKTSDGWIYIMCNKTRFWPLLCEKIGRPQWQNHPKYNTLQNRFDNRDELTDLIDAALAGKTTTQWMADFEGTVPAAPVLSPAQALQSPFVRDFGRIQTLTDHQGQNFEVLRQSVQAGESSVKADKPAPQLGEHTHELLTELGYDEREVTELVASGTVGLVPDESGPD